MWNAGWFVRLYCRHSVTLNCANIHVLRVLENNVFIIIYYHNDRSNIVLKSTTETFLASHKVRGTHIHTHAADELMNFVAAVTVVAATAITTKKQTKKKTLYLFSRALVLAHVFVDVSVCLRVSVSLVYLLLSVRIAIILFRMAFGMYASGSTLRLFQFVSVFVYRCRWCIPIGFCCVCVSELTRCLCANEKNDENWK